MADPPSGRSLYHTHPTTCAPDDFWGQVKRTVDGRPVAPAQIAMIVEQVARGLEIGASDTLLDLCCGNGALTTLFFARCAGGLGVDESAPLVRVATENFVRRPSEAFILQEAVDFVRSWPGPERFTIGLCYGAISYLTTAEAETLLATVHERFRGVRRVFLGNLPDRAHVRRFFGARYRAGIEDDAGSALGIWRTVDDVQDLARRCGWQAEILRMPAEFYAAHYRYDVVLTRTNG
jgi:cyclopropane fatty-acyl-phospholipid synthase-like methyltransferase